MRYKVLDQNSLNFLTRYEEALTFFQKAIEILQKSLGGQHPNTQQVIKDLEALKHEMEKKKG